MAGLFDTIDEACPAALLAKARADGLDAGRCPPMLSEKRLEARFISWAMKQPTEHRNLLIEEFYRERARGVAERRANAKPQATDD